jgi:Protein of unknown function (DUF2878)
MRCITERRSRCSGLSPGHSEPLVTGLRLSYNGSALPVTKRKTVLSAGFLCMTLTLVVLFTSPAAFRSPIAVIVMALIGTAAVLLQLQLRDGNQPSRSRPPLWLNLLGVLFAAAALFPSAFHLGPRLVQAMVLGAVGSFAISSAMILHSFRKQSPKPE